MVIFSSTQGSQGWPDGETPTVSSQEIQKIRSLLPENVSLLAAPVNNYLDRNFASERAFVANAVPRRQAEFSTGRMLAATGLRKLGIPPAPILQGSMKEPVWPDGVIGSITHTSEMCMVAMASDADSIRGLGIDLETRPADFDDLEHMILRPEETGKYRCRGLEDNDHVRLAFSAKESVYKAIFARVGRFVDFQEVRVDVVSEQSRYTASAPDDVELHALVCNGIGRFLITENFVFTIWSYN